MSGNEKIKLNLGCGYRKMHGFINVDARDNLSPDVVADVSKIDEKFKDVDLIYACHVLEHFPLRPFTFQPITWGDVLSSWYRTLKPGGILRLAVPDIEGVCKHYLATGNLDDLNALLIEKSLLLKNVSNSIENQVARIRTDETSPKNTTLYFSILLETRDLIKALMSLLETYEEFYLSTKKVE